MQRLRHGQQVHRPILHSVKSLGRGEKVGDVWPLLSMVQLLLGGVAGEDGIETVGQGGRHLAAQGGGGKASKVAGKLGCATCDTSGNVGTGWLGHAGCGDEARLSSLSTRGDSWLIGTHLPRAGGHIEGQLPPALLEASKGQHRIEQLSWVAGSVRGVQSRLGTEELGTSGAQGGGGSHPGRGPALAERWRRWRWQGADLLLAEYDLGMLQATDHLRELTEAEAAGPAWTWAGRPTAGGSLGPDDAFRWLISSC